MGKITYSRYTKTYVCPKCKWFCNDDSCIHICPKCGSNINWKVGRFVYETHEPTTVKEKLLHAIFGETKKLIKFETRETKDD